MSEEKITIEPNSKTQQNLLNAVGYEALAMFKYMVFAAAAKKDGYQQMAAIFEETAMNEFEHGKLWMKVLDQIGSTEDNLVKSAQAENEETKTIYKQMEADARAEGYTELADQFKEIGEVEGHHMQRFLRLFRSIKSGEVFISNDTIAWKCKNCGYIHYGTTAPDECPACKHPKSYFERFADNY